MIYYIIFGVIFLSFLALGYIMYSATLEDLSKLDDKDKFT